MKSKPKEISWGIKDGNGNILTDKESVLERWAEFYEELYHDDPTGTIVNETGEDAIPQILRTEVEQAIHELKSGKVLALITSTQNISKQPDNLS